MNGKGKHMERFVFYPPEDVKPDGNNPWPWALTVMFEHTGALAHGDCITFVKKTVRFPFSGNGLVDVLDSGGNKRSIAISYWDHALRLGLIKKVSE